MIDREARFWIAIAFMAGMAFSALLLSAVGT